MLFQWWEDLREIRRLPRVSIGLMCREAMGNDPFYERIVREFFAAARRRHPKFPLVRAQEYGVALCELPRSFDEYVLAVEASARRNVKKAERAGYQFQRIEYNRYLGDIRDIRQSAGYRQGKVPREMLEVRLCTDPPTRSSTHDYAYFGILREGRLAAYAGCFISGELAMINHILGHAARQGDGVVPMLIVGMAREILEKHPRVKYFGYGTYYGGGATLRRFKKKFRFMPHRVTWVLGE